MKDVRVLRTVTLICVIVLSLVVAPPVANAASTYTAPDGNTYYYGPLGGGVVIYGVVSIDNPDVVIPDEIDGLPVTIIWQSAFKNQSSIQSVYIPSSVTSLGFYAFKGCSNLQTVTAEGSFQMDKHAFGFCGNLTTFYFAGDMGSLGFNKMDNYESSAFEASGSVDFVTSSDSPLLASYVEMMNRTSADSGEVEPYQMTYNGEMLGVDTPGPDNPEPDPPDTGDVPDTENQEQVPSPEPSDSVTTSEAQESSSTNISANTGESGTASVSATAGPSLETGELAAVGQAKYVRVSASEEGADSVPEAPEIETETEQPEKSLASLVFIILAVGVVCFGALIERVGYAKTTRRSLQC